MYCKKCGKELNDGTKFCQYCGQEQTESIAENKEKNDNISNKQLVIAGVIIAVVILAVIGVFKLIVREPKEDVTADIPVETESGSEAQHAENMEAENPEKEVSEPDESETYKETDKPAEESETSEPETVKTSQISHIVTDEHEYWFDEDGDVIKVKSDDGTLDIQYLTDSMGNKVEGKISERLINMSSEIQDMAIFSVEEFCSPNGYLIESKNYVSTSGLYDYFEVYTYDGKNITTYQHTKLSDEGYNRVLSFQYELDRIIVSETGEDNTDTTLSGVYTFFFDGNEMVECVCDDDYINSYQITWKYDENGKLLSEKADYDYVSNVSNTSSVADEYSYDTEGNLIRHEHTYTDEYDGVESSYVKIEAFQYDKDGNELKEESQNISTEKGIKKSETYATIDSQYDENGNKVQVSSNSKSFDYDETGTAVKQSVFDLNYIWEYDAEGKMIYYSFLSSSTGNNINECKEEYLYDEQGRLTEIRTDGETSVTISYTGDGLLQQINELKDNKLFMNSELISEMLPEYVMATMDYFADNVGNNIKIEYR